MIASASAVAHARYEHTRPQSAKFHHFTCGSDYFIFDVEGGRIFLLPLEQGKTIAAALRLKDTTRAELMALGLGFLTPSPDKIEPPKSVPLKALSLAVAQKCNLGCTYCYAQQGTFGGEAGDMSSDVAKASIDRLLEGTEPGEKSSGSPAR